MLECGRLRAALATATGTPPRPDDEPIDLDAARWLINTVREGASEQRQSKR